MRINKIIIKNFRSYYGENIFEFSKGLTLLIGDNGDGKTTFFCSDCISNHNHIHWCGICGEPFIDKSLPKGKIYQCKDCRGKVNDSIKSQQN